MRPLKLKMQAFGSYGRETVIDFTIKARLQRGDRITDEVSGEVYTLY